MLLLTAIVLGALLVGRLSGGSFSALANAPIDWLVLAPIALVLQVVDVGPPAWGPWLLAASYLLLIVFLARNLRLGPGVWIMILGVAMNAVVILANGGMPVSAHAIAESGQGASLVDLVAD